MATYHLPYAEEHLAELFEEARNGEDVIIVRFDGRSCQLLPLADVKSEAPLNEKFTVSDLELPGSLVPA
ncbi:MAG: hypothetical protein M3Y57_09665 [Acidobacteriota bacterium]|nr:hypothetical protein [Acidobacteriota bacterium]